MNSEYATREDLDDLQKVHCIITEALDPWADFACTVQIADALASSYTAQLEKIKVLEAEVDRLARKRRSLGPSLS